jgi:uncharacterized membrane protein/mono/diheme cytochrome c family protein
MDLLNFLGRLHPLILHLPIGFLVMTLVMEWAARKERFGFLQPAVPIALLLTALTAVPTALFGYLLSWEGGYDESLLAWHMWPGFALALTSAGLYYAKTRRPEFYTPLLYLSVPLLLITGHFGGSLTHGSDYLTEYAPGFVKKIAGHSAGETIAIENLDSAVVFAALAQPILNKKCAGCHNPGKLKGGLDLSRAEGIEKGGENGPVLTAGRSLESELIMRILLPEKHEKHMPPSGKEQLSADELALLQWWIDSDAGFEKKVAECETPQGVKGILETITNQPQGVLALNVRPLSERRLKELQQAGIRLQPMAQGSPFLEADLSRRDTLVGNLIQQLRKASRQVVSLNLSRSKINDDAVASVSKLGHLSQLDLNNTAITDQALRHLRGLRYLERLNLYNTLITDEGLAVLENLKSLKNLYLWQTGVTEEGVRKLSEKLPRLKVSMGMENDTTFKSVQLKAPAILAEKEIFQDSIQVELELNFRGVDIRYTLDGSNPDSSSLLYSTPFFISSTTMIKAVSLKKGWQSSDVAEKQLVRVRYKPAAIALANPPDPRYAGEGGKTLTDFTRGTVRFQEGAWLGWEGKHFTVTLDLGEVKEVSGVTVGALEDTQSWIFFPKGMKVWVSQDGISFRKVAENRYPTAQEPEPGRLRNFTENFTSAKGRYVRVLVESNLANPAWHPGAGRPCWVFVDEILVE